MSCPNVLIGHPQQNYSRHGFPLEFTPEIPAFAGMTSGAGMTRAFSLYQLNKYHYL